MSQFCALQKSSLNFLAQLEDSILATKLTHINLSLKRRKLSPAITKLKSEVVPSGEADSRKVFFSRLLLFYNL